jgi:toxin ParE1/3/4
MRALISRTLLIRRGYWRRFPQAGRKVPEFDDENIRELVVYSYRIIYRLQPDEALIVAVIHGKRVLQ